VKTKECQGNTTDISAKKKKRRWHGVERVIRLKPLAGVNSSFSLESRREQGAKKKRAFIHRAALDNVFRHFLAVFVTAVGGGGGNTLRQHCS
jgi:hypothetical protein